MNRSRRRYASPATASPRRQPITIPGKRHQCSGSPIRVFFRVGRGHDRAQRGIDKEGVLEQRFGLVQHRITENLDFLVTTKNRTYALSPCSSQDRYWVKYLCRSAPDHKNKVFEYKYLTKHYGPKG